MHAGVPFATMSNRDPKEAPRGFHSKLENLAGKPWFWALFVVIAFSWPLVRAFYVEPLPDVPVLGSVNEFNLIDHRDLPFGSKKLQGQVWIAHAMCTNCPSENEKMQGYMEDVQHRARNLGGALKLISITVDPENDTAKVLKEFVSTHPISRGRWRFLTGESKMLQELLFSVFDSQDLADLPSEIQGPILPPDRMWNLVLIDQKMRIRGIYDMREEQAVDRLVFHTGLVVNRHR
jgi:protein SCO1/2